MEGSNLTREGISGQAFKDDWGGRLTLMGGGRTLPLGILRPWAWLAQAFSCQATSELGHVGQSGGNSRSEESKARKVFVGLKRFSVEANTHASTWPKRVSFTEKPRPNILLWLP